MTRNDRLRLCRPQLRRVRAWHFTFAVAVGTLLASSANCLAATTAHELYYERPADAWTEALPLGNGRLGCMVFGGVTNARFQFNEDTLWNGEPHDYSHVGAVTHLPAIRRLLFEGRQGEAENLATEVFLSDPPRQCAYQPFGDIRLVHKQLAGRQSADRQRESKGPQHLSHYHRSLNLKQATTFTEYEIDGVRYTRETLVSYPDQVIAIHLTCSQAGGLNVAAKLTTPHDRATTSPHDANTLVMTGWVNDLQRPQGELVQGAMQFAAHLRVVSPTGNITATAAGLSVSAASEATFLLTAATNFVNFRDLSADPVARSRYQLERLRKLWPDIQRDHIADHQGLYDRIDLRLGSSDSQDRLPTENRILKNAEQVDPGLATLLFNYGRYLMIASSRPGSQPANLQGVWNDQMQPPWDSKYTCNINTEMNYWLVEPCHLEECVEPLIAAIEDLAKRGQVTAREHYGAPGWVLHHNFDLWRGTAPINAANHGIWPSGGAWLCQHLWERYLYSGDETYLRETAYPLLRGAAEFFAHTLVEDPGNSRNWLISGPSNSPEIGGLVMGPTMDHQIIRNLLANTIEAANTLGVDEPLQKQLAALRSRIAPNQIGQHGQLQEWLEDIDRPEEKHRHVSHLWGLHPGSEITPDTPEWFAAARQSLEFRGDGGTGWSRAWKINFWARLRDGDRAHNVLQGLLTLTGSKLTKYRGGGVYPNLFDAHPPFQIDGNFGAANGICEMLVQSHRHTDQGKPLIELLPALPSAWPDGAISGLRTRAGFEIDLQWSSGRLSRCRVVSLQGRSAVLRSRENEAELELALGAAESFDGQLQSK